MGPTAPHQLVPPTGVVPSLLPAGTAGMAVAAGAAGVLPAVPEDRRPVSAGTASAGSSCMDDVLVSGCSMEWPVGGRPPAPLVLLRVWCCGCDCMVWLDAYWEGMCTCSKAHSLQGTGHAAGLITRQD